MNRQTLYFGALQSAAQVLGEERLRHRLNVPAAASGGAINASGVVTVNLSTFSTNAARASGGGGSGVFASGQPGIASSRSHWFWTECRGRKSCARGAMRVYIHARPFMS